MVVIDLRVSRESQASKRYTHYIGNSFCSSKKVEGEGASMVIARTRDNRPHLQASRAQPVSLQLSTCSAPNLQNACAIRLRQVPCIDNLFGVAELFGQHCLSLT